MSGVTRIYGTGNMKCSGENVIPYNAEYFMNMKYHVFHYISCSIAKILITFRTRYFCFHYIRIQDKLTIFIVNCKIRYSIGGQQNLDC